MRRAEHIVADDGERSQNMDLPMAPEVGDQSIIVFLTAGQVHPPSTVEWMVEWLDLLEASNKQAKTRLTPAEVERHFFKHVAEAKTDDVVMACLTMRIRYLKLAGKHGWKPTQALLRMGVDINSTMAVYTNLALLRQAEPELFKTGTRKTGQQLRNKGRGRGYGKGYGGYQQQRPYYQSGKGSAPPADTGGTAPRR